MISHPCCGVNNTRTNDKVSDSRDPTKEGGRTHNKEGYQDWACTPGLVYGQPTSAARLPGCSAIAGRERKGASPREVREPPRCWTLSDSWSRVLRKREQRYTASQEG